MTFLSKEADAREIPESDVRVMAVACMLLLDELALYLEKYDDAEVEARRVRRTINTLDLYTDRKIGL